MVISMTTHPRYQYKLEDLFQMDSSGHQYSSISMTGSNPIRIYYPSNLPRKRPTANSKDGLFG